MNKISNLKISNLITVLEEVKVDANDKHGITFNDEDTKIEFLDNSIWIYFRNGEKHLTYEVYQTDDVSLRFNWID